MSPTLWTLPPPSHCPALTCTCVLSLLRCLSAKILLMLLFVLCLRPVKDRQTVGEFRDRKTVYIHRQTDSGFRDTAWSPQACSSTAQAND